MLNSAISSKSAIPTPQANACSSMICRIEKRFLTLINFESFKTSSSKFLDKMTAAAKTGPAKQPRPASSQPASMSRGSWKGKSFM